MENFTFPTDAQDTFIVADRVNITWTVVAPTISLYETCGVVQQPLEEQKANNYSYVWIATRDIYKESGCNFVLQPFTEQGESYGNNITSVVFGVSKRYTGDPAPEDYNFSNISSTDTTSSTTSTLPTGASSPSFTSTSTSTPNAQNSHGLSTKSKLGIGLGVPLGVILVAAVILAFMLYRRKARRSTEKVPVITPDRDNLAVLPVFKGQDQRHGRLSQTETVTSMSQASNDTWRSDERNKRLSELMSTERVEMP
ncbi:hypothetical protein N7456_001298 [Penicillium angulare]|uniref:Mid2 domain-containing protein n=1 Tax=Penicillium angulare TaxID=116970 RepID=A0A9W9GES7_9EURO|nr:hypothetical protein N7456_001298 [Penicillium angulare]